MMETIRERIAGIFKSTPQPQVGTRDYNQGFIDGAVAMRDAAAAGFGATDVAISQAQLDRYDARPSALFDSFKESLIRGHHEND